MKTEKIVISFIAVLIGVFVAGAAFYFYQTTKVVPVETKTISLVSPTPTPALTAAFLTVDAPKDEDVIGTKTVTINGKTKPDATIVISTNSGDQVITPAVNGNFSTTAVLDDGENNVTITAIGKNGEEVTIVRTVTFSTESF